MLVGPVALSRACYVFCGCCTDRVEGCGTSIAGPVTSEGLLRVSRGCHAVSTARLRITAVREWGVTLFEKLAAIE